MDGSAISCTKVVIDTGSALGNKGTGEDTEIRTHVEEEPPLRETVGYKEAAGGWSADVRRR
jgi:hypothetical protein